MYQMLLQGLIKLRRAQVQISEIRLVTEPTLPYLAELLLVAGVMAL